MNKEITRLIIALVVVVVVGTASRVIYLDFKATSVAKKLAGDPARAEYFFSGCALKGVCGVGDKYIVRVTAADGRITVVHIPTDSGGWWANWKGATMDPWVSPSP